jgi:hypothetical protein
VLALASRSAHDSTPAGADGEAKLCDFVADGPRLRRIRRRYGRMIRSSGLQRFRCRDKRSLEECVIQDVTLAVLAANHPVAFPYVDKPEIGCDRFGSHALAGFYGHWATGAKGFHVLPDGFFNQAIVYLILRSVKDVQGKCKESVGRVRLCGFLWQARLKS